MLIFSYKIAKTLCLLLIFNLLSLAVFGQEKKIDSLQNLLKVYNKEDSIKVRILYSLADILYKKQPDSTLLLMKKAMIIAEKEKYILGIADIHTNMGNCYWTKSNYKQAIENYEKALAYFTKLGKKESIALSYSNIASVLQQQGNLNEAMVYYNKALVLEENSSTKNHLAKILNNIGIVYYQVGNYPLATQHFLKSLAIREEKQDKAGIAACLHTLGLVYTQDEQYEKAYEVYQKSIVIKKELIDLHGEANSLNNIAILYTKQKRYEEALKIYNDLLTIRNQLNDMQGKSIALLGLAEIFFKKKDPIQALNLCLQAQKIKQNIKDNRGLIKSLNQLAEIYSIIPDSLDKAVLVATQSKSLAKKQNFIPEVKEANYILADVYAKQTNYSMALKTYIEASALKDSLFNADRVKEISKIQTNYELDKKKKELILLQNENLLKTIAVEKGQLAKEIQRQEIMLLQKNEAIKENAIEMLSQDKVLQQAETDKQIAMRKQIETEKEKKDKENELLKKEQQIKDIENTKKLTNQRYILGLFGLAFLSALVVAFFVYRGQQKEKKAKNLIIKQKQELEQSKEEIQTQAEQLNTSNQAKDRLFAIIAHDLRSPLVSFQGIAKQLDFYLRKDKPEKIRELSEKINESTQNLNNLLDNLLNWALVQREAISLNPQQLVLQTEIAQVLQGFQQLAETQQIRLQNDIADNLMMWIDKNTLHTIVRNLLSNAIKFTPEQGQIRLSAEVKRLENGKKLTQLYITDTGTGITPEKLTQLFAIANNKSTAGLRGEKGIGIGLNLCYELALLSGATLQASSEVGKGTTFCLAV